MIRLADQLKSGYQVVKTNGIPIIDNGPGIIPQEHNVYRILLESGMQITFSNINFVQSKCMTFELWLDMPSTIVSFSIPQFEWINGNVPDFGIESTRFVIVVRWNGTKLLANLAYTENLI